MGGGEEGQWPPPPLASSWLVVSKEKGDQSAARVQSVYSYWCSLCKITQDKLDGSNYSSWSRSVKLYILGRGKWGYITGIKKLRAIFLSISTAKEVGMLLPRPILLLIWQEIDVLRPSEMKCSADIATCTKKILDEQLYDFFAGLEHHLDRIRGQVLVEDPLPSVQATYAQVCSEANRQATMLAGSHVDGSAMTTTLHRLVPRSGHPRSGQKEPNTL
ncbi:hypothetical protein L3X38_038146 [Prunus dulcis]|uniref:Retrotransposon Copia-like N-terminal domain-containing protein n=1 Tax=Prunus dulcis TaxID=3755 RepID=A0AAD4V528_PRUDU|nr:hypothetical protein L3X38_038146 [Prunus dulcis]